MKILNHLRMDQMCEKTKCVNIDFLRAPFFNFLYYRVVALSVDWFYISFAVLLHSFLI